MNRLLSSILCFLLVLTSAQVWAQQDSIRPTFATGAITIAGIRIDTFYEQANADTFNNVVWDRIYRTTYDADGNVLPRSNFRLVGYIRRDGLKTYYKSPSDIAPSEQVEGLMYDYGMNIGDTAMLVSYRNYFDSDTLFAPYRLDTIVEVSCDGLATQRLFRFSVLLFNRGGVNGAIDNNLSWLDGIGDTYHPYLPTTCLDGSSFGGCETLYRSYGIYTGTEWVSLSSGSCQVITSTVNNIDFDPVSSVNIFPNPAHPTDRLTIQSTTAPISSVELWSATGRLLTTVRDLRGAEVVVPLDRLGFRAGVLVCRVRLSDGRVAVRKVVVR